MSSTRPSATRSHSAPSTPPIGDQTITYIRVVHGRNSRPRSGTIHEPKARSTRSPKIHQNASAIRGPRPTVTRARQHMPAARCQVPGMCCLALVTVGLGPRIALAFWWIFGDRVDLAFGSWIVPLLGLLFLPWTTLMYVIVWSPIGGVEGAEWLLVALGLVLDIATYSARSARGKTSYY